MTERQLRVKAGRICKKEGVRYWFAPNFKFSTDIFNAFDMVILPYDGIPIFVQLTTISHKASRERKIAAIFKGYPLPTRSFIWAFDPRREKFIEFNLNTRK